MVIGLPFIPLFLTGSCTACKTDNILIGYRRIFAATLAVEKCGLHIRVPQLKTRRAQ